VTENRETFFARLEPMLVPSDLLDVQLAYTLAKYGHRAQVRKELNAEGDPMRYFEHPRRVALTLIDEVKIVEPALIIAALLHDGPEDTKDLTPQMIEHCFGSRVAKTVKILSKTPKEGYLERFNTCSAWEPYLVKACDRLDNLRSLPGTTHEFRKRQVTETRDKYYPLFDRMIELVPGKYAPHAVWLHGVIVRETDKQATMLCK
jgi:GTP diphosphokinase / guanosine-3',5'-bis(diphosphate) 3'-diphosphatase